MREDELFGQARSGTFAGQFNFADDNLHPNRTGYACANAVLGQVRSYRSRWAASPTIAVSGHGRGTCRTPGRSRRKSRWTSVSACTSGDRPSRRVARASAFSLERFDPSWGGNPPVFFQPVLAGTTRSARNPLTGQILPATFIGLIVPGTGYNCTQVHHCADSVLDQRHRHAAGWQLSRRRRRRLHRAAADSVRSTDRRGMGVESADGHPRGRRLFPRRHRRHLWSAG